MIIFKSLDQMAQKKTFFRTVLVCPFRIPATFGVLYPATASQPLDTAGPYDSLIPEAVRVAAAPLLHVPAICAAYNIEAGRHTISYNIA